MRRDAVAIGGRLVRAASIGIVTAAETHVSRAVASHIIGGIFLELQAHADRFRRAHVARLVVGSVGRHQVGRIYIVIMVERAVPPLFARGLLVIVFGGFEIAGSARRLAHAVVAGISHLTIFLVAKQVAVYRRVLLIAAPVRLGAAEHAIISVVSMCRSSTRTRTNDGREHQKALGVFHRGHGCLGISADILVVGARGSDAGSSLVCELVDLVVSVTVFDFAALAKGIAINHTTNVGIVVLPEVARSKTLRLVAGSSAPRRP